MASLIGTITDDGRFETLVVAIKAGFLVGTLMAPGPFTLFAPTDEAFALVTPDDFRPLFEDRGRVAMLIAAHIVPARVTSTQMQSGLIMRSLQGEEVRIYPRDGQITVDGARLLQADIECDNGVVHVIDSVLMPTSLRTAA